MKCMIWGCLANTDCVDWFEFGVIVKAGGFAGIGPKGSCFTS
jgi:hypothetical protein